MKNRIREFIKFTASSLIGAAVDLGLFWLLVRFLRSRVSGYIMIATILARIAAIFVNYTINAKLVFDGDEERNLPFVKYITLAVVDMLGSGALVSWLFSLIGWNETLLKIIVDLTLFFVDYFIQKRFIF